jgi:two-component system chemotaxis response regulator CheB
VAPPNHHLIVLPGRIELAKGPRENGFRPAADPLFRTAAESYGPRVVGIVLSGFLDDGTLGLREIKEHGGIVIVQDPRDALSPSMPESAIRHVKIDHVLPVLEMPRILLELVSSNPNGGRDMSRRRKRKPDPAVAADLSQTVDGPPSAFICPECGGSLWELKDGELLHYRCHVGHAYTADALIAGQDGAVEEALWTALRTLEESAGLRRRYAREARTRKQNYLASNYEQRAEQIEDRAGVIRQVLLRRDLPEDFKGYGSSKPAKALSREAARTTKRKPE